MNINFLIIKNLN
ncbi:hypothetical protein N499_0150A, partial [Wolbachia pipientis wVitA]